MTGTQNSPSENSPSDPNRNPTHPLYAVEEVGNSPNETSPNDQNISHAPVQEVVGTHDQPGLDDDKGRTGVAHLGEIDVLRGGGGVVALVDVESE